MTRKAGIRFRNKAGTASKLWIPETIGQGVLLFDFDNDGDLDIYFANGGELREKTGGIYHNALYRNDGNWTFKDITEGSGLECSSWSSGVYTVDFDADGFDDVYVTGFGKNRFFRNEKGSGRFEEVHIGGEAPGYSSSAAFFDADQDGDLDLYVGNYVDFDLEHPPNEGNPCEWKGLSVCCGPRGLGEALDNFYEFKDGRYVEATERFGFALKDHRGQRKGSYTLGMVTSDFDGDGDQDLYVAVDSRPNLLFENLGNGHFREVAQEWQVAVNIDALEQAGMGVSSADMNADGKMDIFVTNFSHDTNTLYINAGTPQNMFFDDITTRVGLGGEASYHWLSWGNVLQDFNCDGYMDIFVASGHVYPQAEGVLDLGTNYRQPNQLFLGKSYELEFDDAASKAGPGLAIVKVSRGVSFGDIDRDGLVDLVVVNLDDWPDLIRNECEVQGGWIGVQLTSKQAGNRHAVGARVTVLLEGGKRKSFAREVHGAGGYLGGNDFGLHFGLSSDEKPKALRVRWPDGSIETFPVTANAWQTLQQGKGR